MIIPVNRHGLLVLFALLFGLALSHAALRAQEGSMQWPFSVMGYITLSSPSLSPDGTTVYVGVQTNTAGRVVAIRALDGGRRWDKTFTDSVDSSPAVSADGTAVYVGCSNGILYSLRASDGERLWEQRLGPSISSSPAVGRDGTIYVAAGDRRLHAVSAAGRWLWSSIAVGNAGDFILASPSIGPDGTIYFGSLDRNFYALFPNGELKWSVSTGGPIYSSAAIGADGTIYFGSYDQRMYAVNPDGSRKWDYLASGQIDASPVLGADGTIYFAAGRTFYALRPGAGEERERWKVDINTTSGSTAAVRGDGAVILGGDDGKVRALEPVSGNQLWSFDTKTGPRGNEIESSPMIGPDGSIYVGSADGNLYKINGNGSPLSAHSSWPAFRRNLRNTAQAVASNTGGQLVNISTRAQAGGGRNLIAGFVVQAEATRGRAYLIRAVGPGLEAQGVTGFMPDPVLQLYSGPIPFRTNDNWVERDEASGFPIPEAFAAVEAFALQPGSKDSAVLPGLPSGAFYAHVGSADGRTGIALVEIYDVRNTGDPNARLLNLSTRGFVGPGESILIAGFVVGGTGSMRLLLRGIGPGLSQFNVPGVLAQPRLTVFRGGTPIGTSTNWATDGYKRDLLIAGASVSAFPLVEGRADAAMLFDASPGPYTLQITGNGNLTGEAMVEIYVLP